MHDKIPAGLTTQTFRHATDPQLQFHPSSLCGRRIRREKRFYATLKNSRSLPFSFLSFRDFPLKGIILTSRSLAMPLCDFLILWFYPQDAGKGREGEEFIPRHNIEFITKLAKSAFAPRLFHSRK